VNITLPLYLKHGRQNQVPHMKIKNLTTPHFEDAIFVSIIYPSKRFISTAKKATSLNVDMIPIFAHLVCESLIRMSPGSVDVDPIQPPEH